MQRMASNVGRSPAGLSYSRKVFGGPWVDTAEVAGDGALWFPIPIYSARLQWWLRYIATDEQVLVGDEVRIGIVGEIRMAGRIRVDYAEKQTWVSPSQIGARWVEYRAGNVVYEYGDVEQHRAEMFRITGRLVTP